MATRSTIATCPRHLRDPIVTVRPSSRPIAPQDVAAELCPACAGASVWRVRSATKCHRMSRASIHGSKQRKKKRKEKEMEKEMEREIERETERERERTKETMLQQMSEYSRTSLKR